MKIGDWFKRSEQPDTQAAPEDKSFLGLRNSADESTIPKNTIETPEDERPAAPTSALGNLLSGTLLASRYRVERELGRGGFGIVYLAHDEQLHGRAVVVKTLSNAGTANLEWAKNAFAKECEALARINHPGVVGVLDQGTTASGDLFIVMQFVEGPSLRDILKVGPLEARRAALFIHQIGEALSAAHGQNIIHRDLKPANIMIKPLPEGREMAVIVDFGIAAVRQTSEAHADSIVAGTPLYMAPEQARGRSTIASDIYSFGAVIHEILTGRIRRDVDLDVPSAAPSIESAVPNEALQVAWRALANDPPARPTKATELARDVLRALRFRLVASGIEPFEQRITNPLAPTIRRTLGGLAGTIRDYQKETTTRRPGNNGGFRQSSHRMVAKLPGSHTMWLDLGNGVTSESITHDGQSWIKSPWGAWEAQNKYGAVKNGTFGPGNELFVLLNALADDPGFEIQVRDDAEYTGTKCRVVHVQDTVREIRMELYIDPKTDLVVARKRWPKHYGTQGPFEETFSDYRRVNDAFLPFKGTESRDGKVLSEEQLTRLEFNAGISDDYFSALVRQISHAQLIEKRHTELLRRAKQQAEAKDYGTAIRTCTEAVNSKPDFFDGWLARGTCYFQLGQYEAALKDFERACSLPVTTLDCKMRLGATHHLLKHYPEAIGAFTEVLTRKPDFDAALCSRGFVYKDNKQFDEAKADFSHAIRLKPGSPLAFFGLGLLALETKKCDEAVQQLSQTIRLNPTHANAFFQRALAQMGLQRWQRALDDLTEALQLQPANIGALRVRAQLHASRGAFEFAVADWSEVIRLSPRFPEAFWRRAEAKLRLNDGQGADADKREALRLGYKPSV